ncbi:MAG: hypothetical protein JWM84_1882 [Nocardioides sp.]|nr:hypothetical protein [Nocardioides sp.]
MSGARVRVVLVPGVLALLPSYGGIEDPVAQLRAACLNAVAWLGAEPRVVASEQGGRVAAYLCGEVSRRDFVPPQPPGEPGLLVVANGSATRTEKAPGHLDDRAVGFDDDLRAALAAGRPGVVDADLARELWADVGGLLRLAQEVDVDPASVTIDYDADPFGVQYWVMRMEGVRR